MTTTTTNTGRHSRSKPAVKKAPARSAQAQKTSWLGTNGASGPFLLVVLIAVLSAFGLMMVLSASFVEALRSYGSSWVFFNRQLIWLAAGGAAFIFAARIDYRRWAKWGKPMVLGSFVLLLLVLIPGVGIVVSGSRRWLGAGLLRMQPSEVAKLALLLFSADLLSRRQHLLSDWRVTLRPVALIFVAMAFLVMMQPDMGTTLMLMCITVVTLFVAGTPAKFLGRLGAIVVGAAGLLAIVEPYRRDRLLSFLDPFKDASNTGYQMVQSLVGIGSGGVFGVGLGNGRAKQGFLPNAHTDFIFAIIAEELGLIGALAVVLLFIGFAALGVRAASRAPDIFGVLMAAGVTAWVVFQAFLNIGAVIGILPVTGVPLPFLSQGGTSLVILMIATGILLNITKQGEQTPASAGRPKPAGIAAN